MTVTSTNQKVTFNGDGSTTVFAYNYKIFAQTDLLVILRVTATGTETTQSLTTNYTVSGVGEASGGNVTMGTAPASGTTLTILRVQPNLQGLDLVPNDPFPAGNLEASLDKLTFMVQTHEEEIGRSIKASKANTITTTDFTISATDRANKVFAFDSSGDLSVTQELGIFRGNWAASTAYAQRDLVKDTSTANIFIVNTAHTSSGSQPITTNTDAAKYDLIVDAASATTSKDAAASSATAAANSATASASSATTSGNSATASANSATTSGNSATTSGNSATASGNSATASANSATASANSATASANSATAAAASATDVAKVQGITNGTVAANKAMVVDANKDISGGRNLTISGELDAATLDISGAIDVAGTANLDVVDIDGAVDMASTLVVGGVVTANAGLVVDNITIDGTEIDLSSGDLTLDVAGNIILDADGAEIILKDGGSNFGRFFNSGQNLFINNQTADKDITFQGVSGGADINALTLDMSAAGKATFNNAVLASGQILSHQTNKGVFEYNSNVTKIHSYGASSGTGQIQFLTGGGGGSSDTLAMAIDSSQNVGIGVTPADSNNFGKALDVGSATGAALYLRDVDGSKVGIVGQFNEQLSLNAKQSDGNIGFYCGASNNEHMRITNAGDLLHGLTTTSNLGTSNQGVLLRDGFIQIATTGTGANQGGIYFYNGNGEVGSISTSGSSTAYNTSSDYRLKTDARPMTGASARIQALNPVNFEWLSDGTRVDGFLAHEAQAVVPECVTGTKDAMKDEEYQVSAAKGDIYTAGSEAGFNEVSAAIEASPAYYDVDGNIIKAEVLGKAAVHEAYDAVEEVIHSADVEQPETLEDGKQWRETTPAVMDTRSVPNMQGIDQSKLVPLLVASLQEALARITALEAG